MSDNSLAKGKIHARHAYAAGVIRARWLVVCCLAVVACDRPVPVDEPSEAPARVSEPSRDEPPAVLVEPRQDDCDFVVGGGAMPERGAEGTPNDAPTVPPPPEPEPIARSLAMSDKLTFQMLGALEAIPDSALSEPPPRALLTSPPDAIVDLLGEPGTPSGGAAMVVPQTPGAGGSGLDLGTRARGSHEGSDRKVRGPSPRVRLGTLGVIGALAPEVVQRAIRARMASFRSCYQRGLDADPTLSGRIVVAFTIDDAGSVVTATDVPKDEQHPDGTTLADSSVVSCVVQKLSTMRFMTPKGGGLVKVRMQLRLSPEKK
jgi:hypothetical protein